MLPPNAPREYVEAREEVRSETVRASLLLEQLSRQAKSTPEECVYDFEAVGLTQDSCTWVYITISYLNQKFTLYFRHSLLQSQILSSCIQL